MSQAVAHPPWPNFGPYQAVARLGEGGMGEVFLAERVSDGPERRVAIKTLRGRADHPSRRQRLERFEQERLILARLEHPNIARLYDAGQTAEGTPYLVMEYVDGQSLDRYCDEKCLDLRQRLRLFLAVCAAVSYAHQNLLVHRDLKPSNILVREDGQPVLLDFGIAKWLTEQDPAGNGPLATADGQRPMTPGYASPEQVLGQTITTATDVYCLGVLLYELLCGRRPYRLESTQAFALERAICHEEPELASRAVGRKPPQLDTSSEHPTVVEASGEELARARGCSSRQLRSQLRGDLDRLLAKALQKDPSQRYLSVDALAADLEAYLEGRPLAARPAHHQLYVWGKWIRRHRLACAAIVLVGVALALFGKTFADQSRAIRAERDKAERALGFLIEVFRASDPAEAAGSELMAREILDGAAERIEKELQDQPAIQATLMDAMGQVYRNLGFFADARRLFEAALARFPAAGTELERLDIEEHRSEILIFQGDYRGASEVLTQLISRLRQEDLDEAPQRIRLATALERLGVAYQRDRREQEAIPLHAEAVALLRQEPVDPLRLAKALSSHGAALMLAQQLEAAEKPLREALALRRQHLGDRTLEVGFSLSYLARWQRDSGDFPAAIQTLRETIQIHRELVDPDYPNLLDNLFVYGTVLMASGENREALEVFEELLAGRRRRLGSDHPDVAGTLMAIGHLQLQAKQFTPASRSFAEAFEIRQKALGADHPTTVRTRLSLVVVDRLAGRFDQAAAGLAYLQQNMKDPARFSKTDLAAVEGEIARLAFDQGRFPAALEASHRALALFWQVLPHDHDFGVDDLETYALTLAKLGRSDEAAVWLRRIFDSRAFRNPHSAATLETLAHLAEISRDRDPQLANLVDELLRDPQRRARYYLCGETHCRSLQLPVKQKAQLLDWDLVCTTPGERQIAVGAQTQNQGSP